MMVFISWSGLQSREYAKALRDWLPKVLQNVEIFFTPDDIDKGARWGETISKVLDKAQVGILCLTRESLGRPWLLFEAGALSKSLAQSRTCPLLFDIKSTDLEYPLAQFQSTPFERREVEKLVRTINDAADKGKVPEQTVGCSFDAFWPELENRVHAVMRTHSQGKPAAAIRTERDLLEEILVLLRLATLKQGDLKDRVSLFSALGFLEAYIAVHDRLAGSETRQSALDALQELRQPLALLARLHVGEGKEIEELLKRIDGLSFSVLGREDGGTRAPF